MALWLEASFYRKVPWHRKMPYLLLLVLTACASPDGTGMAERCQQQGGQWVAAHQECLEVTADACTGMGGQYQECASPCRHQPDAQMCILRCDVVCAFDQPE
ncbi:MAG: hypothetical protein EP312_04940 [Gammaproteobacteria bacterium]|nr:MAG: hypothetical protein EP312_04940 [Gammaproteobacteria bacterium]